MTIKITCPECERTLNVPDSALGKRVRCPACKSPFVAAEEDGEDSGEVQAPRSASAGRFKQEPSGQRGEGDAGRRALRKGSRDDDSGAEDDEPAPRRKKRSVKKSGSAGLMVGLGVGGGVLVLLLAGAMSWW